MRDESRNLHPTIQARIAMTVWGEEYAAQGGGSMDFWDKLSDSRKRRVQMIVDLFPKRQRRRS